jgi:multidrug efflux system membrane fusion protein
VVTANGSTVLAVITQITPITVVFTVAEDSLGQILPQLRKKAKLTVEAWDHDNVKKIATGTLLTLDNQIDTTTGTVKARAQFANADSSLFPNQFVNAHLLVQMLNGVTLIPTAAVQHNGQATFVYVIDPGACTKSTDGCKVHVKNITVGVTNGDTAQVTGINPGDSLATSGFDKLQDGTGVTISTPGSGGGGGASGKGSGGGGGKGKGKGGGSAPSGSTAP